MLYLYLLFRVPYNWNGMAVVNRSMAASTRAFPLNFSEFPKICSPILQFLAHIHLTAWSCDSTLLLPITSTLIQLEWDGSSQQVLGSSNRVFPLNFLEFPKISSIVFHFLASPSNNLKLGYRSTHTYYSESHIIGMGWHWAEGP